MVPDLLGPEDFPALAAHLVRQSRVFDALGLPLYAPFRPFLPETIARLPTLWAKPVTEPHWQRKWGIRDTERSEIVAYCSLTGSDLFAELHRARLAVGVEPAFRRRGFGEALLRTAVAFGHEVGLAWIDLAVLAHNTPALALYRKLGFVEVGRRSDRFRVGAASIEEVDMTLALDGRDVDEAGG
jgi:ribosomal protein S18 acetylase RimI-like enzyme